MNLILKKLLIVLLSFSLFACGDTPAEKVEDGNEALSSMNSMNTEVNGYATKDEEDMSLEEVEYAIERLEKYISHADTALAKINDEDTFYFGDEDDVYSNRSFAQTVLRRMETQQSRLSNPQYIEQRRQEKEAKAAKERRMGELEALIDSTNDTATEIARLQRKTKSLRSGLFRPTPLTAMDLNQLQEERELVSQINEKMNLLLVNYDLIISDSEFEDLKSQMNYLTKYEFERGYQSAQNLKGKENIFDPIIEIIDSLIKDKEEALGEAA